MALVWIGLFGAAVVALFSNVYWATSSYVLSRSDREIAADRAALHEIYEQADRSSLIKAIDQRIADQGGTLYLLVDASFGRIAGNLDAWPSALKGADGWANFSADSQAHAADRPLLRATFETLPDGSHLLVAKDVSDLNEFTKEINTALALAIALIFVLAGLASISVTRRTVGRIEAINAASRDIMHTGLGKRIPERGTRDEWDQLAANLNLMLDRIETLMGEVKQVTDNVAHDLRTPLTRMRARLEKASSMQREADYDQSLINDTISELDGVLRMFSSLTRISQIETTNLRAGFRTVDLAGIANDVIELFDAAAEEKGATLSLIADERVFVAGDRDLLFDAVANLVDNAIKHGRAGGRVIVELARIDDRAVISVADDGPGIPAEEHRHVFKRFYRLERSRRSPGNGLGLSLVAAVANLHGARIDMMDNAPGLRIQLSFPALGGSGPESARSAGKAELPA